MKFGMKITYPTYYPELSKGTFYFWQNIVPSLVGETAGAATVSIFIVGTFVCPYVTFYRAFTDFVSQRYRLEFRNVIA